MGASYSKSFWTLPETLKLTSEILLAYFVYCFFVKPFFSPLRKIPGPSYNPFFGNVREAMQGEAMATSIGWVRRYGGIVRFYHLLGRERILIADPAALRHVMVTNVSNYKRAVTNSSLFSGGIFTVSGEEHAAQRRILNPHFNHESVKYYLNIFADCATELNHYWQNAISKDGAQINIQDDFTRMALDIIGQSIFGYHFNCLKDPDAEISKAFRFVTSSTGMSFTQLIPFYNKLPTARNKAIKSSINIINDVIYRIIRQKRKTLELFGSAGISNVNEDLLGRLMVARYEESEEGLSDGELRDQVLSLLVAGHETTSTTLSWILLLLAQHPSVQKRVQDEVQSLTSLGWEQLDRLTYLTAVIREAQRLYPAAPSVYRQAIANDVIGGYFIPAGTMVAYHVGAMMRNPAIWSDPDDFKPERFLDREVDSTYSHLPFITGPHKCIGHQFAKMQMKTVLAVLLKNFSFTQIPGTKYIRKLRLTLKPHTPIKLIVTRTERKS